LIFDFLDFCFWGLISMREGAGFHLDLRRMGSFNLKSKI